MRKQPMNNLSKIIKAGLIVGTLDILSAFIYVCIKTGKFIPGGILKFIASGIFGKDAFAGGTSMIVAGLIFHYLVAFAFTIFFFWISSRLKFILKNFILAGIIYGIFIWVVMNLVVVPLSNVPPRPFDVVNAIINMLILIICIGLPLSFMAGRIDKKSNSAFELH
ncbi:MAG: hypothetical protein ABJA57_12330 [Ginsengibacter sp.]